MERRKFSREFKLEAVRLVQDRGVSCAQAARAKVAERYAAYTKTLGPRLAKGPKLRQEIEEDFAGAQTDGDSRS